MAASNNSASFSADTKVVHSGELRPEGAVVTPIFQSAMYEFPAEAEPESLQYLRYNNSPNHLALQAKLAALENAEQAVVSASGMAAISSAVLSQLKAGDHVLAQKGLYGGTQALFEHELPERGIQVDVVNKDNHTEWQQKLRKNTRMFYCEALTNPMLHVADLHAIVAFAREHKLLSVIDSTFMPPVNFQPLAIGFDMVCHSLTKYLNGHSDVVGGAVLGAAEPMRRVLNYQKLYGATLDPHTCFLIQRGVKTLALRMERINANARGLAQWLDLQEQVLRVVYPGLDSHPDHERAAELFKGFGGMLCFELKGDLNELMRFMQAVQIPVIAPSLGGVESLLTRPCKSSHAGLTEAQRLELGITPNLIRMSVGIESLEDLVNDFGQALA